MAEGKLNMEIDRIVKEIGYRTYLPQANIPPGSDVDPLKVLKANIAAVSKSDLVLTVLVTFFENGSSQEWNDAFIR